MKAWQLFKSRKEWCRGWFALNKEEMNVESNSIAAVRWCAIGALRKAYNYNDSNYSTVYFDMERKLAGYVVLRTRFGDITKWNDHKNQRWNKVKAVLKKLDI